MLILSCFFTKFLFVKESIIISIFDFLAGSLASSLMSIAVDGFTGMSELIVEKRLAESFSYFPKVLA